MPESVCEMGYGERGGGGGYGGGRGGGGGGYGGGGGGRSERFESREAPVHVGDELDVTISDIAQKGDGIARVEGFIIFVAGAAKGEQCRVRIRDVRARFAIGDKVGGASAAPADSSEAPAEETEGGEEETG